MKYEIDESGALEKAVVTVKDANHDVLNSAGLRFLYVWNLSPRVDEGKRVYASVSKISNRDRDLFGVDVRFEFDAEAWGFLSETEKEKIIDHELMHLRVERDGDLDESVEENSPEDLRDFKFDKEGRICFKVVPHDLDIRRFEEELLRHGLTDEENHVREFLNYVFDNVGLVTSPKDEMPFNEGEDVSDGER